MVSFAITNTSIMCGWVIHGTVYIYLGNGVGEQ